MSFMSNVKYLYILPKIHCAKPLLWPRGHFEAINLQTTLPPLMCENCGIIYCGLTSFMLNVKYLYMYCMHINKVYSSICFSYIETIFSQL